MSGGDKTGVGDYNRQRQRNVPLFKVVMNKTYEKELLRKSKYMHKLLELLSIAL